MAPTNREPTAFDPALPYPSQRAGTPWTQRSRSQRYSPWSSRQWFFLATVACLALKLLTDDVIYRTLLARF